MTSDITLLGEKSNEIRKDILKLAYISKSSHIGSSLSIVDLLTVLYFKVLNIDPNNPKDKERDRFILSKGHAAMVLYATLCKRGFFPQSVLETYTKDGSSLCCHPIINCVPGVEVSTGSLGHGLAIGCGMTLAAKKDKKGYKTFVILGCGECDEGSVWESALFASHWKLDNLIAIIDYNKLQGLGKNEEILGLESLHDKWKSFGWEVRVINGHDLQEILSILSNTPFKKGKPNLIIAETIKGKGVSFMENKNEWHYKSPNEEELNKALSEVSAQ